MKTLINNNFRMGSFRRDKTKFLTVDTNAGSSNYAIKREKVARQSRCCTPSRKFDFDTNSRCKMLEFTICGIVAVLIMGGRLHQNGCIINPRKIGVLNLYDLSFCVNFSFA